MEREAAAERKHNGVKKIAVVSAFRRTVSGPAEAGHYVPANASANRWHLEVRLVHPNQVDAQLESWLKKAIALAE